MSRLQFFALLGTLIVLVLIGAAVLTSNQSAWKRDDARVGSRLLPDLKAAEVAEIAISSDDGSVRVAKVGTNWVVRERGDFPADQNVVTGLLQKLAELKVVQTEPSGDTQRARLQLLEPRRSPSSATKSEAATATKSGDRGTVLELKDGSGKSAGKLILGKTLMKPSDHSGDSDIAAGRYLLGGDGSGSIIVVADPLKDADSSPAFWLDKDVMRADSVKTVTAVGPDGQQRWSLSRAKEGDLMTFVGGGDKPDPQKGQDTISVFYGISLLDAVPKGHPNTGLERPLVVSAASFDGVTYVLRVGAKAGDDRYYASVSSSGEPVKSARVPGKNESPDEKAKKDKEYDEAWQKRLERRVRDKLVEKWDYVVPTTSIAAILKERSQLFPDKKSDPAKKQ